MNETAVIDLTEKENETLSDVPNESNQKEMKVKNGGSSKRLDKEIQRQEAEKKKEELRLKKAAEEDRKRRDKERRQLERQLRHEAEEKEKEEKRRQREEEKRQKEEEKRQKDEEKRLRELEKEEERKRKEEEKRKKEEERLQKELEKKREDEERQRKQEKQKSLFENFFKKGAASPKVASQTHEVPEPRLPPTSVHPDAGPPVHVVVTSDHGNQPPATVVSEPIVKPVEPSQLQFFRSKPQTHGTRMCPLHRVGGDDGANVEIILKQKAANVDAALNPERQKELPSLYLHGLLSGTYKPSTSPATWPLPVPDVLVGSRYHGQIFADQDGDVEGPLWLPAKLFQFVENYRPAYYGTWRKSWRTTQISPRRPFAQDSRVFDYSVDSDDEWDEEAEQAENISNSEGEDDEEGANGAEEEDDGFVVPHGYLSEDEGASEESDTEQDVAGVGPLSTSEMRKLRQKLLQDEFEASRNRQVQPLRARLWGVHFVNNEVALRVACGQQDEVSDYLNKVDAVMREELLSSCAIIWPSWATKGESVEPVQNLPVIVDVAGGEGLTFTPMGPGHSKGRMGVPEEAIPHLLRLLHNNPLNKKRLNFEFRMYWTWRSQGGWLGDLPPQNANAVRESAVKPPSVTWEEDCQGKDWGVFNISRHRLNHCITQLATWEDGQWKVNEEVLQRYNIDPQTPHTPWVYVSDVQQSAPKTPTRVALKRTSATALDTGKAEETPQAELSASSGQPTAAKKRRVSLVAAPESTASTQESGKLTNFILQCPRNKVDNC